jgi:aspartate/methionine/tyrosine aminotransferase
MPGSYFGKSGKGHLRATLFISKPKIHEAINRIEAIKDW